MTVPLGIKHSPSDNRQQNFPHSFSLITLWRIGIPGRLSLTVTVNIPIVRGDRRTEEPLGKLATNTLKNLISLLFIYKDQGSRLINMYCLILNFRPAVTKFVIFLGPYIVVAAVADYLNMPRWRIDRDSRLGERRWRAAAAPVKP